MAPRSLDGPRLKPLRGPARQLVVLLHGYGADGNDLISLAGHWQDVLPEAAFVAPNAPERCGMAGAGFQWFALSRMDPHELRSGCEVAGPVIDAFLDSELARHRLAPEQLALVGFSQGTMLALAVGLKRNPGPAAIVGFSGVLAGAESLGDVPAPAPVLLTHGDQDQVIPAGALFMSAGALGAAGIPVQWHLAHGMGHGIDPQGLALAGHFLHQAFRGGLRPRGTPVSCRYPR